MSGQRLPRIRLYVNGADRLAGSSENEVSALMRPVGSLVADIPGTGIGVVIGGSPALLGRRITQRVNRRFALSMLDPGAYPAAGVPRSAIVDLGGAHGRAYDATQHQVVQLGLLSTGEHGPADVLDALGQALGSAYLDDARGFPEPMPEVRWPLPWARLDLESVRAPANYGPALPIGVDTDTACWHWIDAEEDGPLVPIGGPTRSGRSATLVMLADLARSLGWSIQVVAPNRRSPVRELPDVAHDELNTLEPAYARPTLYVVDDAHRLDPDDSLEKILKESTQPILVALSGPQDMFGRKSGVLRGTPDVNAAVTLAPATSTAVGDARIPDYLRPEPRAGRGVLWRGGELRGVLVPLAPSVERAGSLG